MKTEELYKSLDELGWKKSSIENVFFKPGSSLIIELDPARSIMRASFNSMRWREFDYSKANRQRVLNILAL
jgi:hypothetical protein